MSRAVRALSGLLLGIGIGITAITIYFISYACVWKALALLNKPHELSETLGSWSPILVLMAIMAALGAILTKAGADLLGKTAEVRREVRMPPVQPPSAPPTPPSAPPSAKPEEFKPPSITPMAPPSRPSRPPEAPRPPSPPPSFKVEAPRERELPRGEEGPARIAFEVARRERLFPPPPAGPRRPAAPAAEEARPEEAPRGPERPELPPPPSPRPPEARPGLSEDELNRILRILRERRKKA